MSNLPDDSQRRAIFAPPDQSILITAPPGYGKTYVMPRRIEYLIKSGFLTPPERALGLTFTNAAASEMKSRLEKRVPQKYLDYIDATTFHSFAYSILQSYGDTLGVKPNFRVLPTSEKKQLFRKFFEKHRPMHKDDEWYEYDEWEREVILKLVEPTSLRAEPLFGVFWERYKPYLLKQGAIDFNHLLWFGYKLLQTHPEVLEIYRQVYQFILVDEFQDTSPIQFEILKLLVNGNKDLPSQSPNRPVFIFADDWQSIYRFLGAVPKTQIIQAEKSFNCKPVNLDQDHRTSSASLSTFGRVLRHLENPELQDDANCFPLYISPNPLKLAEKVNDQIKAWIDAGIKPHDIAILARNKKQLLLTEKSLAYPYLSIPDLQADSLEENPVFKTLIDIARQPKWRKMGSLLTVLNEHKIASMLGEGNQYIRKLIFDMASGYDMQFSKMYIGQKALRMVNEALLEINWGQQLRQLGKDRIFVGTLHSAKGLEFSAVAMLNLEQSSFPAWFFTCRYCMDPSLKDSLPLQEKLDDEWRVFYVGVTRAKDQLAFFSSFTNEKGYFTPVSCLLRPEIWMYLDVQDGRSQAMQSQPIHCKKYLASNEDN